MRQEEEEDTTSPDSINKCSDLKSCWVKTNFITLWNSVCSVWITSSSPWYRIRGFFISWSCWIPGISYHLCITSHWLHSRVLRAVWALVWWVSYSRACKTDSRCWMLWNRRPTWPRHFTWQHKENVKAVDDMEVPSVGCISHTLAGCNEGLLSQC